MTKNTMKKNTLPNDFVIADSYTVIEPALSNFKKINLLLIPSY